MKSLIKYFLPAILLFSVSTVFAQTHNNKFDVQIGISIPELIHFGFGIDVGKYARLNFSAGTFPDSYYPLFNTHSFTGGASFYFGKINEKRSAKKWAYNTGLSYLKDESKYYKWKYFYFNNSVSYDVYLSPKLIFQPELGFVIKLSENKIEKPGAGQSWFGNIGPDPTIFPKPGIKLKYYF